MATDFSLSGPASGADGTGRVTRSASRLGSRSRGFSRRLTASRPSSVRKRRLAWPSSPMVTETAPQSWRASRARSRVEAACTAALHRKGGVAGSTRSGQASAAQTRADPDSAPAMRSAVRRQFAGFTGATSPLRRSDGKPSNSEKRKNSPVRLKGIVVRGGGLTNTKEFHTWFDDFLN